MLFFRLNGDSGWCPKPVEMDTKKEYIEVDLQDMFSITAIDLQGRYAKGRVRNTVMVKNLNENVELLIIFKFHKTQAKCLSKLTLFGFNSNNQ